MNDRHVRIYGFDPEECKRDIEQSILFALDREKEQSKYEREKFKMIGYVSKYMYAINEDENINYGVEIAEVTERCIKAYDPSVGTPFLAYFNKAWKNECRILKGKEFQDQNFRGMHVNKKVLEKINKYVRYAKSCGIAYDTSEFIQLISDEINRNIDETREYIKLISAGVCTAEIENTEEEPFNLFDSTLTYKNEIEDLFEQEELMSEWFDRIEIAFDNLQNRQKPIISDLLTFKIVDSEHADEMLIKQIYNRNFFNKQIYIRMQSMGKITARVIAIEHGVTEQSASRTFKNFLGIISPRQCHLKATQK